MTLLYPNPNFLWVRNLSVASLDPVPQGFTRGPSRSWLALGSIWRVPFQLTLWLSAGFRPQWVVGPWAFSVGLWGTESFLCHLHLLWLLGRKESLLGSTPGSGGLSLPRFHRPEPSHLGSPVWGWVCGDAQECGPWRKRTGTLVLDSPAFAPGDG